MKQFISVLVLVLASSSAWAQGSSAELGSEKLSAASAQAKFTSLMDRDEDHGRPADCHYLVERFRALQEKLQRIQGSVVDSVRDTSSVMSSWYYQLASNEGRTIYIPHGTYRVILTSSQTESENARYFDRNFNELSAQMSAFQSQLLRCL